MIPFYFLITKRKRRDEQGVQLASYKTPDLFHTSQKAAICGKTLHVCVLGVTMMLHAVMQLL